MNIKIILKQPYPHGFASTNRVHLYAKGMVEEGHNVDIHVPIPPSENRFLDNNTIKGKIDGISFRYTSNRLTRSNNFVKRRIHDILGVLLSGLTVYKERKNTDAIILISTEPFHILFYHVISRLSKAAYLTECNEYPFVFARGWLRKKKWFQNFYIKKLMALYDGLIIISNNLLNYYKNELREKVDYKLIPVLVDCSEFDKVVAEKQDYIAYAGNLSQEKDGIYTQLKAFSKASKVYPNLKFYVIGKAQHQESQKKVNALVDKLGIKDKVIFTGFVSREFLVKTFKNAKALMLFKPEGIQAEYCFPSKTAEYLASASPVVTTSTGELKNYLVHQHSAMLSDPKDHDGLAKNLIEVLSNEKLSTTLSNNGYRVAKDNFDYKMQSREIVNFIKALNPKD